MSVSKERLTEFSKYVLEHDALEEIQSRVAEKLLTKFRQATYDQRKEISNIMDAELAFLGELKIILAENAKVEN